MSDKVTGRDVCTVKTILGDTFTVARPFHEIATLVGQRAVLHADLAYQETGYREYPGVIGPHGFQVPTGWWIRSGRVAINGRQIVSVLETWKATS